MRYTPTLKLSTRLVAFVTMIVISAMFILFIGGTLSFKRLGHEYLTHYLEGIVEVIDKEMEDPDAAYSMQRWMPKMLQASNIVEMQLLSPAGVVYRFKNTAPNKVHLSLFEGTYPLERNQGYQVYFKAIPPYVGFQYSMQAFWSITLAVLLVVFCLLRGVKWLKEQLIGSEMLEERGRMILAGRVEEYAKGDDREWPYTASEALDTLIEELRDARQERSRFDTFIRSQTFLDQVTGTANRVLFDNKLDSALQESGSRGGVLLIRIQEWNSVEESIGKQNSDDFLREVGGLLGNLVQRYPDAVFSRYYQADFAIFIPHIATKDIANLASQCIRQLDKLTPPEPLEKDNWCHIGMTMYREGERHSQILDEAETAIRGALLQNSNNWSRFQKWHQEEEDRGSVRWRTLFDKVLYDKNVLIFAQPAIMINDAGRQSVLHKELSCRINDPESGVVKASRFMPAIRQVGYEAQLDKAVMSVVLMHLKRSAPLQDSYSMNLHVTPFAQRDYFKWFRDELLQVPQQIRRRLSFEFVEAQLVRHLDYMRPVAKMIVGLGCRLVVGQAGRSIVSTHYLKDLGVHELKLHRSLVKKIEQSQENQLFVRSMLGAAANTQARVIAVGVETQQEWQTLQDLGVKGAQGRLFAPEQQIIPPVTDAPLVVKTKPGRRNRWRRK